MSVDENGGRFHQAGSSLWVCVTAFYQKTQSQLSANGTETRSPLLPARSAGRTPQRTAVGEGARFGCLSPLLRRGAARQMPGEGYWPV